MTAVVINLPPGARVVSAQNKVTLTDNLGHVVTLPITDPRTSFGQLAPNWVEVPKPGLVQPPFLVRGPRPLRSLDLTVTVVNPADTTASIEDQLTALHDILQASKITLAYASYETRIAESGAGFVCTSYQPTVVMRDPASNAAIQASATVTLKEANPPPSAANAGAAA